MFHHLQLATISIVGWSRVCCLAYPFWRSRRSNIAEQILLTDIVQSTWVTILGNSQYPTADLSQFAYLNSIWYNDYSSNHRILSFICLSMEIKLITLIVNHTWKPYKTKAYQYLITEGIYKYHKYDNQDFYFIILIL